MSVRDDEAVEFKLSLAQLPNSTELLAELLTKIIIPVLLSSGLSSLRSPYL